MMNSTKKFTALLLALLMIFNACPFGALAETAQRTETSQGVQLPGLRELQASVIDVKFYVDGEEYDVEDNVDRTATYTPEVGNPAKSGYKFLGWSASQEEGSEIVRFPYDLTAVSGDSISF